MHGEVETLVDFYNWSVRETKRLTVRERRFWFQKVKTKIENRK